MRIPYAIALLAFLAISSGIGCSSSDGTQGNDVIPPSGIRATISPDFPEAETRMLRALAFTPDDLPTGFELQYEDAKRVDAGISYIAHYADAGIDMDRLFGGAVISADIVVLIADTNAVASSFFDQLSSMSQPELEAYAQQQSHWPNDPEVAAQLHQVGIEVKRTDVSGVADPRTAWTSAETVKETNSDRKLTFYDVTISLRRGRVFGAVDLGSSVNPPNQTDVVKLANQLSDRISVLSP